MGDFGFFLLIIVLVIFTSGEPDLLDTLIASQTPEECVIESNRED